MRQGMLQREKMEKVKLKIPKAMALCSFHYLFVVAASHCSLSFSIIFGFLPVVFANFFQAAARAKASLLGLLLRPVLAVKAKPMPANPPPLRPAAPKTPPPGSHTVTLHAPHVQSPFANLTSILVQAGTAYRSCTLRSFLEGARLEVCKYISVPNDKDP